jgi:hypothetical protein
MLEVKPLWATGEHRKVGPKFTLTGKSEKDLPVYANFGGVYRSKKADATGNWDLDFAGVPPGTWDLTVSTEGVSLTMRAVEVS